MKLPGGGTLSQRVIQESSVLTSRPMQLHMHTPAYTQINLVKQIITPADRFYLPHTTSVKLDVVFKGNQFILSSFFF